MKVFMLEGLELFFIILLLFIVFEIYLWIGGRFYSFVKDFLKKEKIYGDYVENEEDSLNLKILCIGGWLPFGIFVLLLMFLWKIFGNDS